MNKGYTRHRSSFRAVLGILSAALFSACQTTDDSGTPNDASDQNGSPSVAFQVQHYHYPDADQNAVRLDDLPDPILIRLNGIPGRLGGSPTADHLFDTALAGGASFQVPWARLLQVPTTQPVPFIRVPKTVDSISPASVKIMRVGTFADGIPDDNVFPDSVFEAYGFYDTELEIGATAVYFSGPATIHADYRLCDSTRMVTHLDIPSAGFYFLYLARKADTYSYVLLPGLHNLVFSVRTLSSVNYDYVMGEYARQFGCLTDEGEPVAGAAKIGLAGPPSFREWLALSR
jgi:hypothetical protein